MIAQLPTSFLGVSASEKARCRHVLVSAMRTSWADAQWQALAPFFKAIPDVFPPFTLFWESRKKPVFKSRTYPLCGEDRCQGGSQLK